MRDDGERARRRLREGREEPEARFFALRLAVSYAVAAAAWIVVTDAVLALLRLPRGVESQAGTFKGLLFVVVTTLALYVLTLRAAARLHATRERYRRLFENAPAEILIYRVSRDAKGRVAEVRIEDANEAQLRNVEDAETLVGSTLGVDPLPPRLEPSVMRIRDAVAGEEPVRFEVTAEDAGYHALVSVFPLERDVWVSAATDVSELRRVQRELERQQESIREAYVEVLDALTGGKLLLLTEEELRGELGEPIEEPRWMSSYEDVSRARSALRSTLEALDVSEDDVDRFLHPFAEAATNVVKHAVAGTWMLYRRGRDVQLVVSDRGPGIAFGNLPKAARGKGFSTAGTLGMGFTIMLQYADRVLLATSPGRTSLALEVGGVLPEGTYPPTSRTTSPRNRQVSASNSASASSGTSRSV